MAVAKIPSSGSQDGGPGAQVFNLIDVPRAGAFLPMASGEAAHADSRLSLADWAKAFVPNVILVIAAWLVAANFLLGKCAAACGPSDVFRVSGDLSMFAALFALALAVERALDPLSRFLVPGADERKDALDKADVKASQAVAARSETQAVAQDLANARAAVDRDRAKLSVWHWGIATTVALLLAGGLNVLLLVAIGATDSAQPNRALDLLVTGLIVGAGTKPLHDLISKLEKSKAEAQTPASTSTTT